MFPNIYNFRISILENCHTTTYYYYYYYYYFYY